MKKMTLLVALLCLVGCSTVTLRSDGNSKDFSAPSYQQRFTFWMWGLVGFHSVNVREVCGGREVEQMQTVFTLGDIARNLFTLGIYAPRSARVWCEEEA